jgi:hypothetical protein
MRLETLPFNIGIEQLTPESVKYMRPVRVLDTHNAAGTEYHPDGLFSLVTFGRQGSEERDLKESYIDLKTTVFHPEIYMELIKLRAFYAQVMAGKAYALWDDASKDFVASDPLNGQTGYQFFMEHWQKIQWNTEGSDIRKERIAVLERYKAKSLMRYHLVIPAGLRDIHEEKPGKTTEDEINDLYRKLLAATLSLQDTKESSTSPLYDNARIAIQKTAVAIYLYIKRMVSGKRGWLQGKWGARKTFHGTRNVITPMTLTSALLGSPDAPRVNDTEMGLWQFSRGAVLHTLHCLQTGWLGRIFGGETDVWLTNKKTLQKELVQLDSKTIEDFTTRPGLEKLINRFEIHRLRNRPVYVENYYLGLVYRTDRVFKFFADIRELPEGFSKEHVYPITLGELLYVSLLPKIDTLTCSITRYPITDDGSVYPSFVRVRTTSESLRLVQLNEEWQPTETIAPRYPVVDGTQTWIGSLKVNPLRYPRLGADLKKRVF